jgi:hypothetical protein
MMPLLENLSAQQVFTIEEILLAHWIHQYARLPEFPYPRCPHNYTIQIESYHTIEMESYHTDGIIP